LNIELSTLNWEKSGRGSKIKSGDEGSEGRFPVLLFKSAFFAGGVSGANERGVFAGTGQ
jgi:hypothetical protein